MKLLSSNYFYTFLVVGLLFLATVANVSASTAGPIKIYLDANDLKTDPDVDVADLSKVTTRLQFVKDDKGNYYFCLDETKYYPSENGTDYTPSETIYSQEIIWLLNNFYDDNEFVGSPNLKTKYVATQIAIWSITNPDRIPYSGTIVQNNPIVKALVDKANEMGKLPKVEEQFNKVSVDLEKSLVGLATNDPLTYDLNLNIANVDPSMDAKIKDIKIYLVDGANKTDVTTNPNVQLTFDVANGKGTVKIAKSYINTLPAGSKFEIDGSVLLTTNEPILIVYTTENNSYQPLGSPFKKNATDIKLFSEAIAITQTIDIKGTKTWNDRNDKYKIRPSTVTITLYANNVVLDKKDVSSATYWKYEFLNLPKYDENNQEIIYRLEENTTNKYTSTWDGWNVTNTYLPTEIDVSVNKQWANETSETKRPLEVIIELLANGQVIDQVILNNANNWSHVWKNLLQYDENGLIVYGVAEKTSSSDYNTEISANTPYDFTITNTFIKILPEQELPNEEKEPPTEKPKLPQTNGELNNGFIFGMLLITLALIALIVMNYRRLKIIFTSLKM